MRAASWQNRAVASTTITRTAPRRRSRDGAKPFLFIALRCDRPLEAGARVCLEPSTVILIGRAPTLSAVRNGDEMRIGIPDARISSTHLRFESVLGEWVAQDTGSKNGTLLDGRPLAREALGDGALLEVGHTFLLFRAALPARDATELLESSRLPAAPEGFRTLSPAFAVELERLRAVAASPVPVLLRGESGTGKELLAAAIHRLSGRPGLFQPINCGAISPNIVESELFGHRRGAFSGAVDERPGLVRQADRGTLLLDEIGDLPLPAQAALLRVLQEGEVLAVGAARPVKVDLRVVSATHRDVEDMVARQLFRADLLARISGYVCRLPPLRERREDFSLFVADMLGKAGASDATFTPEAARALLRHSWPLNLRELEKCLASAVALAGGGAIDMEHLPPAVREASSVRVAPAAGGRQRDELIAHLRAHRGNVTAVARAMGKARTQVQRWLHRFGLDPIAFRR